MNQSSSVGVRHALRVSEVSKRYIDMDVACWIVVRWCLSCGVVALVWGGLSVGVGWFLLVVVGADVGLCGLAGVPCLGMVKRPCLDWVGPGAGAWVGWVSDEVFYGAVQGLGDAVGHGDGHAFDGA